MGIKRKGSSFRDGSQVSVIEYNSNKNSNNKKRFVVIILIM